MSNTKTSDIIVEGVYKDGKQMRKSEVIFELTKASLQGGHRYADRAIEVYNELVQKKIFTEKEISK